MIHDTNIDVMVMLVRGLCCVRYEEQPERSTIAISNRCNHECIPSRRHAMTEA